MALAPTGKVVLGSIAFAVFWILAVFPSVPFLPIGRTAGSLLGAMLMVLFRVESPEQAYDSVDLPILSLLFSTMLVSVYLERADMFKHLGKLLSWKCRGPKDLLCRICIVSAISSALFTNDTTCVVLTEFVLKVAKQNNVKALPFLLALASSANIGSSATPIGNPQNLVIAIMGKISFKEFLVGVLPAMLVGVVVNVLILLCMYWKVLVVERDAESTVSDHVVSEKDVISHRFSPVSMSGLASVGSGGVQPSPRRAGKEAVSPGRKWEVLEVENGNSEVVAVAVVVEEGKSVEESEGKWRRWRRLVWKQCVYVVSIGMLVALLLGVNMSWTALTAALILLVLDFKDAKPMLDKVSYPLLIFFCGMFITVDGFSRTGIPSSLWSRTEPYAQIDSVRGIAILSLVVLVLSNLVSNVPTVLLLGAKVASSAAALSPNQEKKAWLILAWVSTVAGNLSLLGSAANLIVCEQAHHSELFNYNLSFWKHLKFGVPSTLVVTTIGLTLIRA